MGDRVQDAVGRARAVLDGLGAAGADGEPVEKTIWGSPAGKKRLAPRLVKLLPKHRVYVEPFAGSAAVLFEKEPAEVEAINDADPEIGKAFRIIRKLNPKKIETLRGMTWTGDEATFKRLLDASPRGELEQLHRFLYLTHFSYGKMRGRTFSPNVQGIEAKTMARLERHAPRLAKVKVHSGDYEPVVRKYDGADTAFFLDPPYPGYNVDVGESKFDEERFFEVLKSLKGKWLMTYGIRGKLPKLLKDAGFHIKRIRTPRTIGAMRGVGGPSVLTQVELDAKLFKAEVRLSDEVLEDSIERGELRQTIMEMMAEAISRDMEEVLINGDTLSADPFLAVMDGVLKQATSNIVDAAAAPIAKDLLRDMLKTLPSEHLRDKKAMRFMTSVDADLDYRNTLADRATVAGDRLLEGDTPVLYSGVPLQPIPLFPENLGAGSDQTVILLCNPKNIHVGIWRNIRVESARDISEGTLKIVATLRFDVKFAEEPGVAKAINVQL